MIYKIKFVVVKITTKNDARTGIILNQSWEVVIDESIDKKLPLPFSLICTQKIDNGYTNLAKLTKKGNKYTSLV